MPDHKRPYQLKRRELLKLFGVSSAALLSACAQNERATQLESAPVTKMGATSLPSTTPVPSQNQPTLAPTVADQMQELLSPLELAPLSKNEWMTYPVIPDSISQRMKNLYQLGQQMGRDAHRFSIIGDCQSIPVYFLAGFDGQEGQDYFLGSEFADLQKTVGYFQGSFSGGVAANGGQNVAAVFSPLWSDPAACESNEGPLACELHLKNPCLALISLEENWNGDAEGYQANLINIVEYCIGQGVIPVLTTKASNLEGDHSINRTIADTACRYELPLWNYWLSLQDLPAKGLLDDGFHLTQGWAKRYDYRQPDQIKSGWAMRNLTGLQMLDLMRRELA